MGAAVMTGWLVRWSLKFRLIVLAAAAGILGYGFTALPSMPVDNLPEFSPPHVEIQTEALGLSAIEVEQLITSPMEKDLLNGVAWLDEIRSKSVPGLSTIEMVFEPGTDILRARQLVAERLTQAHALPNVSSPPVLMQPLSSTSRVMMVQMSSGTVSPIDMSVLARWDIKPALMGVPGVANVSIYGHREQQLQVQVDPKQLRAKNVTLKQVVETAGNAVWVSPLSFLEASTPGTGGFLESANQRIGIQHVLPIRTPADLGRVSVEGAADKTLTLADVTTLSEDHQPLIGDAVTGTSPGLLLVIEKFPNTSVADVTRGIEAVLDGLRPGLSGITMDSTVFRPASFIESAVGSLGLGLLVSLLMVTALIGLVFRSWRYALLALVSISVAATAAALVLQFQGAVMNVMAFAGLVLALVVVIGDVIIDLHSFRRELADERVSRDVLLAHGLQRSRIAVLFAGLAALLALAPALFVPGVEGAFLKPLVLSYLLATAVAMLIALTVTPALASLLVRGHHRPPRRTLPLVRRARLGYERSARAFTGTVATVFALTAAALAVTALVMIPGTTKDLPVVAAVPDRTLLIEWEAAASTGADVMNRVMTNASEELSGIRGVSSVDGHVGRAVTSDSSSDVNAGELWVTIEDGINMNRVRWEVWEIVGGYPGLTATVTTYPEKQVAAASAVDNRQFRVRVYGADLDVLRQKADEVREILAGTQGVVEPHVDVTVEQPVAEIEVDLAAAQKQGIKPGDVRRAAATVLQGIEVGYLFEQQKVFQVVVKGTEATRSSLTSVADMMVDKPEGGQVRLGDVAKVSLRPNQSAIHHDNTSRRLDIVADIQGRSLGDVSRDVEAAIQGMQFPVGYHAEIPSQYAERQAASAFILWLALVAAAGILVLLLTVLGNWRLAGLVFLLLPVALSGGILAAELSGGFGSVYVLVALAAVLAVAIRDVVMLMGTYQSLQSRTPDGSPAHLMRKAAGERLLPTVLTTVITGLALVPLVLLGGPVGAGMLLPLALVVWGGLITSALLTLFVLPILFLRIGPGNNTDWGSSSMVPATRQTVTKA
ncbi:efflux RND transporter permease subunit [Arthrobacter sp. NPDC057009]|uniref:efflux RND transporter permease subunit n=1 Tax=Arthrobacter sp. NPDC057009 TaxID=3345996 RepID=UPI003632433C